MRRGTLQLISVSLYNTRSILSPAFPNSNSSNTCFMSSPSASMAASVYSRRHFSSESDLHNENPISNPDPLQKEKSLNPQTQKNRDVCVDVQDVSNKELKTRIEKYFKGDEEALPAILEAILARKLAGKHDETDDELMEELRMKPLDNVNDQEFESDFEDLYETDEEINDLYNARDVVMKRMVNDEYFNMDDKKWEDMIKDATDHGCLKDTRECEAILEDMLSWEKLLPDDTYIFQSAGGLKAFLDDNKVVARQEGTSVKFDIVHDVIKEVYIKFVPGNQYWWFNESKIQANAYVNGSLFTIINRTLHYKFDQNFYPVEIGDDGQLCGPMLLL